MPFRVRLRTARIAAPLAAYGSEYEVGAGLNVGNRLNRGAGAYFGERFIKPGEVGENARAVVANDDALIRIEFQHSIQTSQRFVVIAIQPGDDGPHKVHARIVRSFASQFINRRPGFSFLAARKIDKHHVQARFQQMRIKRECLFTALPRFMVEGIKASNRPAAAAESMRNEVARGFQEVAHRLELIPTLLLENQRDADH